MKRFKRHKVKTEAPETSTSHNREHEVHDLAYYIHDRVELMHQVFSVLKYKELKAMAPACIRNISLDDLQELCTEELLGISSKRLCAILDGAEPPSDTESSSPSLPPEQMETISLDSISSDEEILSQTSSKKKKHKHRRHSKSKAKRKKSKDQDEGEADRSKASRAGLTVLELLELQARARAIRAQLQQEQQNKPPTEETQEPPHSSDNEVEIKEEPAEVVEISSDDEKPKIEELQQKITQEKEAETPQPPTVTKRIKDLIITVPQKTKQKIKLNRNKSVTAPAETSNSVPSTKSTSVATTKIVTEKDNAAETKQDKAAETKKDKPRKKKAKKKTVCKDDIDNDEITLQLSDTEKMDLLEDLDRKNYDCVSSCSDSSSESSSESDDSKKDSNVEESCRIEELTAESSNVLVKNTEKVVTEADKIYKVTEIRDTVVIEDNKKEESAQKVTLDIEKDSSKNNRQNFSENVPIYDESEKMETDSTIQNNSDKEQTEVPRENSKNTETVESNLETGVVEDKDTDSNLKDKYTPTVALDQKDVETKDSEKNLSEGELSDRESSEVETVDLKPEVVCISDEEGGSKSKKKKKKKDKKSKKEKKSKKKDFRESADQNFYKDNVVTEDSSQENPAIKIKDNSTQESSLRELPITKNMDKLPSTEIIDKVDLTAADNTIDTKLIEKQTIDRDLKSVTSSESLTKDSDSDIEAVYEILELSDDSSCCEVECTILSKEPTALEIEALSAKIDEIDGVEVITDREIRENEKGEEKIEDIENISWKDRYLDSKKVKKVLSTANILNALRKKNIELKKKLEESKKITEEKVINETEKKEEEEQQNILEEGSIEHYNTLEALTTYVDPVKEVPKDLKKDAKLLLKMYKKLLKYNDMNKPKDPQRKKKKKKKIKKDTKVKEDSIEDCGKDKEFVSETNGDGFCINKQKTEESLGGNNDLDNKDDKTSQEDNINTEDS